MVPFKCRITLRTGSRVIAVDFDPGRIERLYGMLVVTTVDSHEFTGGVGDISLLDDYVRVYYVENTADTAPYLVIFVKRDGSNAVRGTWRYVQNAEIGMASGDQLPSSPEELPNKELVEVTDFYLITAG